MWTDENGMPVQADGDRGDQLNRVGILGLSDNSWHIKMDQLLVKNGIGIRHVGANPNNVSGDQLVPVFATEMIVVGVRGGSRRHFGLLTKQLFKRLGFAQNTHDTDGSRKLLPDFLLHRVLPFIARVYAPMSYTASKTRVFGSLVVYLADIALLLNTLVTVIDLRLRNNPDHVDPFVNAVATLYACNVYRPTSLSKLSARMLDRGSIKTLGTYWDMTYQGADVINPNYVVGGLVHYHRAASGGNIEIGEIQIGHWIETLRIARS